MRFVLEDIYTMVLPIYVPPAGSLNIACPQSSLPKSVLIFLHCCFYLACPYFILFKVENWLYSGDTSTSVSKYHETLLSISRNYEEL